MSSKNLPRNYTKRAIAFYAAAGLLILAIPFLFYYWAQKNSALEIIYFPSPNCDSRPEKSVIDTVVLHATERERLAQVVFHFSHPFSRVSAHYIIDRDGKVYQHVLEEMRAWHAGNSQMPDGRVAVNDFSIGIELVNRNDGIDSYTSRQIRSLIQLLREIKYRNPIRFIVSHARVAQPTGRKSDPRNFDYGLLEEFKQELLF